MRVRCFTLDQEPYWAIKDIMECLGYFGPTQIHARRKILANISAGDITYVHNEKVGRGSARVMVINTQGLEELMEDYPELREYMEF